MSDSMTVPDSEALKKLVQLRISGEISEEEFARANARDFGGLDATELNDQSENSVGNSDRAQPVDSGNKLSCFLHLSQLLGYLIPLAGLLAPVIIWLVFKQKHAELTDHIRNVFNWVISMIIYVIGLGIVAVTPLAPVSLVGIFALVLAGIVFPIIAGVKAFGGDVWSYPMALRIL